MKKSLLYNLRKQTPKIKKRRFYNTDREGN